MTREEEQKHLNNTIEVLHQQKAVQAEEIKRLQTKLNLSESRCKKLEAYSEELEKGKKKHQLHFQAAKKAKTDIIQSLEEEVRVQNEMLQAKKEKHDKEIKDLCTMFFNDTYKGEPEKLEALQYRIKELEQEAAISQCAKVNSQKLTESLEKELLYEKENLKQSRLCIKTLDKREELSKEKTETLELKNDLLNALSDTFIEISHDRKEENRKLKKKNKKLKARVKIFEEKGCECPF